MVGHLKKNRLCPKFLIIYFVAVSTTTLLTNWFLFTTCCANFLIKDLGTPIGTGIQRNKKKRKFLNASDISDFLSPGSPYAHGSKRQSREGRLSTVSSATFNSSLGSPFFDSPDIREPSAKKVLTARHQTCLELLQTEQNYVKVLETIIMVRE